MKLKNIALLIFAYNRPSHLKRVLVAIEDYKISSDIVLIIDGPKNKQDKINQKSIFAMTNRFKKRNFKLIIRKRNLGLAKSITLGIDYFAKKYEGLIILEDDVVPYKSFFLFIKKNFNNYKNEKNITAICGYTPKILSYKVRRKEISSLLFKNFIPWGWCISGKKWIELKKIKISKNFHQKIPKFFSKKFNPKYQKKKKKKIWTINFILKNYLKDRFYLFPNISLVKNIGFDGTGVNSKSTNTFDVSDKQFKHFKKNNPFLINKNLIKKQSNFFEKNLDLFY